MRKKENFVISFSPNAFTSEKFAVVLLTQTKHDTHPKSNPLIQDNMKKISRIKHTGTHAATRTGTHAARPDTAPRNEALLARLYRLAHRNARLEAERLRHRESLVCLATHLARLERENARLKALVAHSSAAGQPCEACTQPCGAMHATHISYHYHAGALHVSGSHLTDARFALASPAGTPATGKPDFML